MPGGLDSAHIELIWYYWFTIHRKDSSVMLCTVRFIKHKTYLTNVKDQSSKEINVKGEGSLKSKFFQKEVLLEILKF